MTSAHALPTDAHHARGTENVFWFLHVSDVHIGSPLYGKYEANARRVFDEVVPTVQPWFVLVSGDLVDGAKSSIPTLGQVQAEWDLYRSLYEGAGMTPDFYFDLPGNHDGYGDIGLTYYLANSLLGRTHNRLFVSWTVEIPAGQYLFFGLNSAGEGSGSFFEKPEFTLDEIDELEQTLQSHASARLAILAGHHPLSSPANGSKVVSALQTSGGGFYLHGHEHEYEEYLAGSNTIVVNQIDSLAAKESNNVGVVVVDHDAVIYRATGVKKPWPHVMVTAPVSIDLRNGGANPYAYDVCKDRTDNPVRAMIFSTTPASEVTAQVGGAPPGTMSPSLSSDKLWTVDLDTTGLTAGVHDVTVTATVGGETSFHKIRARFVDGPCDVLPEDPPPAVKPDAGVADAAGPDSEPDAEPEDAGGGEGGDGGEGASGGSGGSGGGVSGSGGTSSVQDAGVEADSGQSADSSTAEGGCSCLVVGRAPTPHAAGLLLLGLLLACCRRRRH
jgi:hypothetical protein